MSNNTTATTPDTRSDDQLATVAIGNVIEHHDNVRSDLGDLTDLTRSIKNKGVLIPALVLPADTNGNHALVAGHRRRAAAEAAGLDTLTVIIRDLTPVEVLDTMLTENDQRTDLTLAEQIKAVARYQALAPDESPTAIGKRIGRTVRWIKDRFAVAALPSDVIDRIGIDLTLAAAVAVAPVVERGDDLARQCAAHVIERRRYHDDPAATVAEFLTKHDATTTLTELLRRLSATGVTVFESSHEADTNGAVKVQGWTGLQLDDAAAKAHRGEPCHAEMVRLDYSDRITRIAYCTTPKRHKATTKKPAESAIVITKTATANSNNRDMAAEKEHRAARETRIDVATAALTKRVPKIDTQRLAASVLIDALDQDGRKLAARILGVTFDKNDYPSAGLAMLEWLDTHPDPTPLLAALAIGHVESRGTKSSPLTWYGVSERQLDSYNTWREANTAT